MSSTSSILGHISAFRNPTIETDSLSCLKIAAAQCAYIAIIPYATVEAAISQIVRGISYCLVNQEKYQKIADWANSSAYGVAWTVHCVFVNLCTKEVPPTENDFKANILNLKQEPDPIPDVIAEPDINLDPIAEPDTNDDTDFIFPNEISDEPYIIPPKPQPKPTLVNPKPEPIDPKPAPVNPMPQPVIAVPTSKDPAIARLLRGYKLGDNARQYSNLMEKIYRDIPEPDDLQLYGLVTQLTLLLKKRGETRTRNKILLKFEEISMKIENKQPLPIWEDRLLKMTVAIYNAIDKLTGDDLEAGKEILISGLLDAFENCSNRQSAEIERLYFRYVAPNLLIAVEAAATPVETFTFELMQYRTRIRDEIINRLCPDEHNAASHRYFRKTLNEGTFYLPPPLLSEEDNNYAGFAQKQNQQAIIAEFQKIYNNPGTIYDIFIGLLYPRANENFRFKPEMFLKWLDEKGHMNADSFSDEMMTIYKPEIMIAFLQELNFLKK